MAEVTGEGLWRLWAKPCVARGYCIAFSDTGRVIYDGLIADITSIADEAGKMPGIGDVWLNPLDARLFVKFAKAKGDPGEPIQ